MTSNASSKETGPDRTERDIDRLARAIELSDTRASAVAARLEANIDGVAARLEMQMDRMDGRHTELTASVKALAVTVTGLQIKYARVGGMVLAVILVAQFMGWAFVTLISLSPK